MSNLLDDVARAITEAWGERAVCRADVNETLAAQTARAALQTVARWLRAEAASIPKADDVASTIRALASHLEKEMVASPREPTRGT